MDFWRLGLIIATAIFLIFLLSKLRPSLEPEENGDDVPPDEPPPSRAERHLYKEFRKLPRVAQERVVARLEEHLSGGNDSDDDALGSDSEDGDETS